MLYVGEINTLQGNLNWVASREHSLNHPVWGGREHEFLPLTSAKQVRLPFRSFQLINVFEPSRRSADEHTCRSV